MTISLPPSAFGDQIAKYFHLKEAASLVLAPPSDSGIAITRLTSNAALPDRTCNIPPEKAFLIPLHLYPTQYLGYEVWVNGAHSLVPLWTSGGIGIYDLEANPVWRYSSAFDCVHYHLPRATLNAFTDDSELPRVEGLSCAQGRVDTVLHHLAGLILPFLGRSHVGCQLFMDSFVGMFCAHLVATYGVAVQPERFQNGLAPWQRRKIAELMRERLDGDIRLASLAGECRLSVSHFARSFKKSFDMSVHRYFMLQRVEKAKHLLAHSDRCLSEIALEVGFSDQAAFCRAFGRNVGISPGKWRRERRTHCKPLVVSSESGVVPSRCNARPGMVLSSPLLAETLTPAGIDGSTAWCA